MVLQGKAGGGAAGRQPKFIDYFLPKLVVGNCLASTPPTHAIVEFEQIELLATDLRDLHLGDSLAMPEASKPLPKPQLVFMLVSGHSAIQNLITLL